MFTLFSKFYILMWFAFIFLLFCSFLLLSIYFIITQGTFLLTCNILHLHPISLSFSLLLDSWSSLFSSVVCMITAVVFMFTSVYFSSFNKISYFIWITSLFVLSMLFLINFSDMFFVMLGWDGLGVVSFFLILYYQSPVSSFSALLTVIMNRLGDSILILVICIYFTMSHSTIFLYSSHSSILLSFLLLAGLSTKRALFPFSPWLPAAIAAPTPISSLVHSSTLVTAGLYLVLRNYDYLSCYSSLLSLLTMLGLFTSLYAGLSALVESDLKKVVALSTLSHLGFISFSMGLGWVNLAMFHLLSHALFKSSLFISLGSFISFNYHYQDSRYFSSLSSSSSLFTSIILISEANLFALPFLRGFYSKDYILEALPYSYFGGPVLSCVVYFNVILTYCYSLRTFLSLVSSLKINRFYQPNPSSPVFSLSLFLLSLTSLFFGLVYTSLLYPPHFSVPFILKCAPSITLILTLLLFCGYFSSNFGLPSLSFLNLSGTTIIYLSHFWGSFTSRYYLSASSILWHTLEQGVIHHIITRFPYSFITYPSTLMAHLLFSPLKLPSITLILTLLLFLLTL